MQCLRQYEKATLKFRTKGQDSPDPLFLSYIKPNKPVTSQRIAHWIKDLLKEAGIDVSIFKAHSVRGASTTAALSKGVSVADILHTCIPGLCAGVPEPGLCTCVCAHTFVCGIPYNWKIMLTFVVFK